MQARRVGRMFGVEEPTDGVVRGFSDVVIQRNGDSEWVASSRQAAVVGETVILELNDGELPDQLAMCVIESRRFVLDGDTRHWIRLQATDLPPVLFEQQIRRG